MAAKSGRNANLLAVGATVCVGIWLARVGAESRTTTLRIYSHLLPSMQDAAADAMDRTFKAVKMER